jgi:hypothetical protein
LTDLRTLSSENSLLCVLQEDFEKGLGVKTRKWNGSLFELLQQFVLAVGREVGEHLGRGAPAGLPPLFVGQAPD